MTGMDTILYFPASSKAAAQEKLAGAKDTAARCGVHVQVVAREPTVGVSGRQPMTTRAST